MFISIYTFYGSQDHRIGQEMKVGKCKVYKQQRVESPKLKWLKVPKLPARNADKVKS